MPRGPVRCRGGELQEQPLQVLMLLLEHAGELVTREQLTQKLWADNTFVDFDRGLNKAINRLRDVLRDDADKPRFIETLPHRGYRFIAPVEGRPVGSANTGRVPGRPVPQPVPRIDSLAVLPLDNHTGDPGQEYFSDGMTEELITAITMVSSLRVISRTSVMRYKGVRKSLPAIARELGVDGVVEGSVARSDQKVRITAQLIHAPTDRHLWSGRYERELRDVLQLQADIATDIASHIHRLLEPVDRPSVPARHVNPQAYEACLRGIFYRDKMTPADLATSIGCFTQAIELDPAYVRRTPMSRSLTSIWACSASARQLSCSLKRKRTLSGRWRWTSPSRSLTTPWLLSMCSMSGIGRARKPNACGPCN